MIIPNYPIDHLTLTRVIQVVHGIVRQPHVHMEGLTMMVLLKEMKTILQLTVLKEWNPIMGIQLEKLKEVVHHLEIIL